MRLRVRDVDELFVSSDCESAAGLDGTNVEAVDHGPAERSADSFVFTREAPS